MKKPILFFVLIACLASCTITKRHYRSGYHIEWYHRIPDKTEQQEENTFVQEVTLRHDTLVPIIKRPVSIITSTMAHTPRCTPPSQVKTMVPQKNIGALALTVKDSTRKTRLKKRDNIARYGSGEITHARAVKSARLSFLLGILSFVVLILPLFNILSPLVAATAVETGWQAMDLNRQENDPYVERKARAGIKLGRLYLLLFFIIAVAAIVLLGTLMIYGFAFTGGIGAAILFVMLVPLLVIMFLLATWMFFKYVV